MKLTMCVRVIGAAGTGESFKSVEHDIDEMEDFDTAMKETAQDFEVMMGSWHTLLAVASDRYYTERQAWLEEHGKGQGKAAGKPAEDAKPDVLDAQDAEGGAEVADTASTEPVPPAGEVLQLHGLLGENGQAAPQDLAATPASRLAGSGS